MGAKWRGFFINTDSKIQTLKPHIIDQCYKLPQTSSLQMLELIFLLSLGIKFTWSIKTVWFPARIFSLQYSLWAALQSRPLETIKEDRGKWHCCSREGPAERKSNKRCIMLLTIRKQLYDFLLFLIFILAWCPKNPSKSSCISKSEGSLETKFKDHR